MKLPATKVVPDANTVFPAMVKAPAAVTEAVPLKVKSPVMDKAEAGIVLVPLPLKIKLLYLPVEASGMTTVWLPPL